MLENLLATYVDNNAHRDANQILNLATKTHVDITKWQIIKPARELFSRIFTWMDANGLGELIWQQFSGMSTSETITNGFAFAGIGIIALWIIAIRPAIEKWAEKRERERSEKAKDDDRV